ncbi:hypothetical protein LCGC14_2278460 [marine sediment metagenome]|uniref:RNA polymerase alpha subunit C-terminal domain-containing protein n=1 Tax=marine sediment metagenome TaxID=412755 RepID=A0A0F9CV43_9ZZZZ
MNTRCPFDKDNLDYSIYDLELSERSHNCLKRENIFYLATLAKLTAPDLLKIRGLGKNSLDEIKHKLSLWGFVLGMKLGAWVLPREEERT